MGWREDMSRAGRRARDNAQASANDWREEMRAAAAGERPAEDITAGNTLSTSLADSTSLGLSGQVPAIAAGFGAMLNGGDYSEAYSRRVQDSRRRLETMAELYPLQYASGQLGGMAAWALVPGIGQGVDVARGVLRGESIGNAMRAVDAANRASHVGEAGSAINRTTQTLRNAVNMEWLPFQRQLTSVARAGGPTGVLAEFGKAGLTGIGYGSAYAAGHADWSNPGEAANSTFWGGVGGGLGGVAFRGVAGLLGNPDPAWRTLMGGVIGAGAGAAINPTGDRVQGAEIGAAGGAAFGRFANPALLGWTRMNQPVTRAISGGLIGGTAGTIGAIAHNAETPYEDEQVDVPAIGLTSAAAGAAAAYTIPELIQRYGAPMVRRIVQDLQHPNTGRTYSLVGVPPMGGGGGGARRGGGSGTGAPPNEAPPEHIVREIESAIRKSGGDVNAFAREVEAVQGSVATDAQRRANSLVGRPSVMPFGATAADSQVAPELGVLADTFANMPGETRSLAQRRLTRLNETMDRDLVEEARHFLNAEATPSSLHDRFQEWVGRISDDYNAMLNGGVVRRDVVASELAPIVRDPVMQPVMARRFQQEELEAQAARTFGRAPPTRTIRRVQNPDGTVTYEMAEDITGRGLQQIKKAIDQETGAGQDVRNLTVEQQERMNTLREYRREWVRRMGRAIPGYDALRSNRQGLFRAMEALDLDNNGHSRIGSRLLRMRPEEIRRRMLRVVDPHTGVTRDTTEAEQAVYRMAVADELVNSIEKYVSDLPTSARNASEPLSRSILRERVRAVFGDSPGVDRFFDRAMERGRLMINMRSILGNSASARRLTHALDQTGNGILEMIRGDPVGVAHAFHMKHALEGRNNELGRYLLADLSSPKGRALWDELMPALREFERQRLARATGAGGYGIGSTGYNSLNDMLKQMGIVPGGTQTPPQ